MLLQLCLHIAPSQQGLEFYSSFRGGGGWSFVAGNTSMTKAGSVWYLSRLCRRKWVVFLTKNKWQWTCALIRTHSFYFVTTIFPTYSNSDDACIVMM